MFLDNETTMILVKALGWALIHFLWQGAAVGLLFAVGKAVLARSHPSIRYRFGLGCMLILALAPLITAYTLLDQHAASPAAGLQASPAMEVPASPVIGSSTQQKALGWSQWFERALPYIVLAWGLGVLAMSMRVFVNWRRMRRLVRHGVRPLPEPWQARISELKTVFGIDRAVAVLESTLVEVPTVLGYFKPVILLPTSSLIGLTPHQLELVVAHELGHIRRLDYLINLMQVAVETTLFYHPVVGWISRHVREEREKCCDDLVISRCGHPIEYAKALANLESIRAGDYTPALAATDGQLIQRIQRIVHNHKAEPREAVAGNTAVLVAVALAVMAAGRLSDPLRALEERRARIADALVAELMMTAIPAQSEALLAPLDNARAAFSSLSADPEPVSTPSRGDRELSASSDATAYQPQTAIPVESRARGLETVSTRSMPPLPDLDMELDHSVLASRQDMRAPDMAPPTIASPTLPETESLVMAQPTPLSATANQVTEPNPWSTHVVKQVAPEYPVRARISGVTGFVELSFAVGPDGSAKEIVVESAHPRRVFESAALRAIKKWKFDPSGTLVTDAERITQRFDFTLNGTGVGHVGDAPLRECRPLTGTRICRTESPTVLMVKEANPL